jgi:hypothetical protein
MAFAARSHQPVRATEQQRTSSVCRVHSCVRCNAAIDSVEPCSFVRSETSVCDVCRGQEQVVQHLPVSRAWGVGLARARRA